MNREWLLEHHQKGLSQREIAKLANVSAPTIRAWFKKHNIPPRTISEALKLKPTIIDWTEERRNKLSNTIKSISASYSYKISQKSKAAWKTSDKILPAIRRAAKNRRINIDTTELLSDITLMSIKNVSIKYSCSKNVIRRHLKELFGINNIREFKKIKIDIKLLIDIYMNNTQKQCGEIYGVSGATIGRILQSFDIDTSIHFGDNFKNRVSEIVKTRWTNEEYRHKMAVVRSNTNKISSIQHKLYEILDGLNEEYKQEFQVGPYVFDCKIGNILIECNGNYWHSLDKTINNDNNKLNYILKYYPQYSVKAIWEHEFKNIDRVKNLVRYWLYGEHTSHNYDFTSITINNVESKSLKDFFGAYHYLSNCPRGGIAFSGTFNLSIVIAVLFSPLSRQNLPYDMNSTLELSRLCVNPSYQKKNLCSWFVSRIMKMLPPNIKHIISYSDMTYNHTGSVYKSLNFKLNHIVKPDYWYINSDGWAIHKKTVYNRAIKSNMSELEYAKQNELNKIYGKEKYCYRYDL